MRYFILCLFMSFTLQAQILTETFSNFIRDDTASVKGFWVLDDVWHTQKHSGTTIEKDISSKGNNFTYSWASYSNMTDSLQTGSILYSGGKSLLFDGVDDAISCGTSSTMAFGSAYTIAAVILTPNPLVNDYEPILTRENAINNINYDLFVANNASTNKIDFVTANATANDLLSSAAGVANTWYVIVAIWDGTQKWNYTNQVSTNVTPAAGGIPENRPTDPTYIGKLDRSSLFFKGQILTCFVRTGAYTKTQALSFGYLANDWNIVDGTGDGGATRNNFAFSQGVITDTIYYNTTLTAGTWSISVDVDGNSGGETYRILTSADASTWSDLGSGTAPASSTTKTFSGAGLGYIGLAVSSAADTVFFDNLTVSLAGGESGYTKNKNYKKYPGF